MGRPHPLVLRGRATINQAAFPAVFAMSRVTSTPQEQPAHGRRSSFARAIERKVRDFVLKMGVLRPGEKALVAVSGGGDSTAMLLALSRLAPAAGWSLTVAHFDHMLRSREEAAEDAAFVSRLSSQLGLPMVCGRGDVARRVKTKGESVEQAARVLRYRFLATQARTTGATVVLLGHTLDDQAETVLLHLIRGSGVDGLAGMRPRSAWPFGRGPDAGRPVLALRREEMRRYCREHRVEPRDDPTNELLLATRNRARHDVMPALRGLNPRVDEALARLATAAADDAAVLRATAENALNAIAQVNDGYLSLDITGFQAIPAALRGRVLRLAVGRVFGSSDDLESVHVDALVRLAGLRSGRASLPHGLVAVRDSKSLTLCRGELPKARAIEEMRLIVPGAAEAGGWRFEAVYAGRPETVSPRGRLVAHLDADAVAGGMHIRSRRPGDRVRPLGLGGEKKLQDVFVDAKIPASERDGIPLLVADWGIAWVPGLCIDERARVTESTEQCVRVRARRPG